MPVIKMKPTSPGTRFVVKLDKSHLWKGGPHEPLTVKKTRHSGRADPMRRPGISGEKMIRRSVEVSVPPPGDSYRVVAGNRMTVSLGSSSIIGERTTSSWMRVSTSCSACRTA